jgi:hypothetical protein
MLIRSFKKEPLINGIHSMDLNMRELISLKGRIYRSVFLTLPKGRI